MSSCAEGGVEASQIERSRFALAAPFALLLLSGCSGNGGPTGPGGATVPKMLSRSTTHFELVYDPKDSDKMPAYESALESNYDRILRDLEVTSLSRVTGHFYPDQASFDAAFAWAAGEKGLASDIDDFSVVTVPFDPIGPVHEFTHCASLVLDIDAYRVVWLWESVAVWETHAFVPPANVPCIASGDLPTLERLSSRDPSCSVYDLGFTIGEFIVQRWGPSALHDLLAAHGDVQAVLGISVAKFEADWHAFLKQQYL
jgi:hypothetical protein